MYEYDLACVSGSYEESDERHVIDFHVGRIRIRQSCVSHKAIPAVHSKIL